MDEMVGPELRELAVEKESCLNVDGLSAVEIESILRCLLIAR